jgi:hypothetical protein
MTVSGERHTVSDERTRLLKGLIQALSDEGLGELIGIALVEQTRRLTYGFEP